MDSCHKVLELNAELMAHMNEAQVIEAIKDAEVHHTTAIKEAEVCIATTIKEAEAHHAAMIKEPEVCQGISACVLEQTHRESVLMLEQEARVGEGWDHQAFAEAFGVAI